MLTDTLPRLRDLGDQVKFRWRGHWKDGVIVGRTRCETPTYDLLVKGTVYANVAGEDIAP